MSAIQSSKVKCTSPTAATRTGRPFNSVGVNGYWRTASSAA